MLLRGLGWYSKVVISGESKSARKPEERSHMIDILIRDGYVLTMDKERRLIEDGAVAIQGDRIVEVGKSDVLRKKYEAKKVIDAREKLVMPGFVDAHAHLGTVLARGMLDDLECVPWIERMFAWYFPSIDEEAYYHACSLSCVEMIKSGTTTTIDCGTATRMPQGAVKAVEETGLRAVLGLGIMDIYDPPALPGTPDHLKETTESSLTRGEDFIRKYHKSAGGRIHAWLVINQVPNTSDALCKGAKALVDRYDSGISAHVAVVKELVQMTVARFGLPDIERFAKLGVLGPWFVGAHMGWINGRETLLMKEFGATAAHLTASSMHGAYGSISRGRFPEMVSMGVNVALGCDGGSCSNHFDMVRQMYLMALAHREVRLDAFLFPPLEVIELATINGAKALGLEKEVGSLEAGKKADVILFDLMRPEWVPFRKVNLLSNLVYAATGDSVHTTIIDGKVVMENREVKTVKEEEVLRRAQKAFGKLVDRADWLASRPS